MIDFKTSCYPYILVFLIKKCADISNFIRIYKLLCYTRLILRWFPFTNRYKWPVVIIRLLTDPYFNFFNGIIITYTPLRRGLLLFRMRLLFISFLNSLIYLCHYIAKKLLFILEKL